MHDLDMDAAALGDVDAPPGRASSTLFELVAQMGEIGGVVFLQHVAERHHLRRLAHRSRAA